MELEEFANICDDVAATSGNAMRDVVTETLENSDLEDAVIFTRFLLGELYDDPEKNTGVGESLLVDAAAGAAGLRTSTIEEAIEREGKPELGIETAYEEASYGGGTAAFGDGLDLSDLYSSIQGLPEASGNKEKVRIMQGMFANADSPKGAKWIAYCIVGELAIGAGAGTVKQAVAQAFPVTRERVDKAYALLGMMTPVVRYAKEGEMLPEEPVPGMPFIPMLASSKDIGEATGWFAQPKYDGARAIIHSDGEDIRIFTRNRREVTESLPEVIEALSTERSYIIDGEAVAFDPNTGDLFENSYRKTMERFRREKNVEQKMQEIEIGVFVFDIVYLDGETLGNLQLHERVDLLDDAIGDIVSGDVVTDPQWSEVALGESKGNDLVKTTAFSLDQEAMFNRAINLGHEGTIVKSSESSYEYGERSSQWRKSKPDETVDLEVTGWQVGTGDNAGLLGALELSTSDGHYIGNVGTGFSDEFRVEYDSPDSIVGEIVEIRADTLQDKLRFPRFIRIRETKDEADSYDRVKEIFG